MRLDLTEDQSFFQETARRFLEAEAPVAYARRLIDDPVGFESGVYQRSADLGWLAPLAPEAFGGGSVSGRAVADLAIVAEETGRTLFPGPVLESNLAAAAIAGLGRDEQKARHLPDLVSGRTTAALAWSTGEDGWPGPGASGAGVSAQPTPERGWRLSGSLHLVPYGSAVDLLIVAATLPDGPIGLFLVPAVTPGITSRRMETLDLTRPLSTVDLAAVDLPSECLLGMGDDDPGGSRLESLLILASVLQCAETVGAMERGFEMTLDYAKSRRAFGRPIGSFQAIKHRLADMVLWLEWSKAAVEAAVEAFERGGVVDGPLGAGPEAGTDVAEAASVAKSVIGEHGPLLVRSAVQVYGGIGYTWEHDIHLFLRRVEANGYLYGSTDFHRSRLARLVGFPVPA